VAALLVVAVVGTWFAFQSWLQQETAPMPPGEPFLVRYEDPQSLEQALAEMEQRGVVRNAEAAFLMRRLARETAGIGTGTFRVRPGMTVDEVIEALQSPLQQMVRLPEGFWSDRYTERLLENRVIESEEEYLSLRDAPEQFTDVVSFELPEDSLEGFLYPDTYDLPPLFGARNVIERQLQAFEDKVIANLPEDLSAEELERALVIASMVELEAGVDKDRPLIAGVIENRLDREMRLQIDATLLYQINEWREVTLDDYRDIEGPYSTYKNTGLPPGPIGNPSWRSIEAALNPAEHDYLYYVARPNWEHYFAETYAEHRQNIRRAAEERRAAE
jgi:UPF0755 protein